MSDIVMDRICKDCKERKSLDNFYFMSACNVYTVRCRPCHLKRFTKKKLTGFVKLPLSRRIAVANDLKDKSIKDVAKKYKIFYGTLLNWINKGSLEEYGITGKNKKKLKPIEESKEKKEVIEEESKEEFKEVPKELIKKKVIYIRGIKYIQAD